ncbi:MAG: ROK family protein [Desulfuromonadales bacterium]|nr:ROK family protein [Desulfuromonadales bacterium]
MIVLGVDIGGSAIKAAPVDTERGSLSGERYRLPTPQPAVPLAIARSLGEIMRHFNWTGAVGCGLPAAVHQGIVRTAANIDKSWIDVCASEFLGQATGSPITVLNDADAAGLAEMRFGQGVDRAGTVIIVTVGTGLGTALFRDGTLVPNTELGHLILNNQVAETYASGAVKTKLDLSFRDWAPRLDAYLRCLEELFWPDLLIIGGGICQEFDLISPFLTIKTETCPALLGNDAGIIGAALAAAQD